MYYEDYNKNVINRKQIVPIAIEEYDLDMIFDSDSNE